MSGCPVLSEVKAEICFAKPVRKRVSCINKSEHISQYSCSMLPSILSRKARYVVVTKPVFCMVGFSSMPSNFSCDTCKGFQNNSIHFYMVDTGILQRGTTEISTSMVIPNMTEIYNTS